MIALLVVQTLAIGLLAYTLIDFQKDVEAIVATDAAPLARDPSAQSSATRHDRGIHGRITETQLRQIIAEEIRSVVGGDPLPTMSNSPDAAIVLAERSDQRRQVEEEIEYHISVGTISRADMEALQAKIARLDPTERRSMLNKLVQAMNAGLIDGRL